MGQHNLRSTSFQSECNGATTAGAIFWEMGDINDLQVNRETIGPFVALSAYLFEATQNATYMSYAMLSTAFIQAHLFNGQIIADTIDIGSCFVEPVSDTSNAFTYDSGFVIEGWSVLADATQNETLEAILDGLIFTSVQSPVWTNTAGINTEQPLGDSDSDINGGYKAFFMRGLYIAWSRNDPAADIAQFISAYITVQFNALLKQAAQSSVPDIYSANWTGGSPPELQIHSQATALHALIPAFALADRLESPSPSTSDTGTQPPSITGALGSGVPSSSIPSSEVHSSGLSSSVPSSSVPSSGTNTRANAGAVIGAVIGGLVGIGCLAASVAWALRRRRRSLSQVDLQMEIIEPFDLLQPTTPTTRDPYPFRTGSEKLAALLRRQGMSSLRVNDPQR